MVALGAVSVDRGSAALGGAVVAQISVAFQQRVRNRQPDGGLSGDGTSPLSRMRSLRCALSSFGAADISAAVYGWLGRSKTASVGPFSMIRPRYMTETRSATWRTTDRSWLMKM